MEDKPICDECDNNEATINLFTGKASPRCVCKRCCNYLQWKRNLEQIFQGESNGWIEGYLLGKFGIHWNPEEESWKHTLRCHYLKKET